MFHVLQGHSAERSSKEQSTNHSSSTSQKQKTENTSSVKADRKRLQSKISRISNSIKLKENQKTRLQKKIYSFDKKIESLSLTRLELIQKQTKAQDRLDGLEQEKTNLLVGIEASSQSMADLIRAFYILQLKKPVNVLLNQEDVGKTGRMKTYHDYLIKDYLKQYQELNNKYSQLKEIDQSLITRLLVLEKLVEKNNRQATALQESYEERNLALEKLTTEIASDKSEIESLKADEKRLEKLAQAIAKIEKKKTTGMSFAEHKGGLIWPVNGKVVQRFGRNRAGSKLKWRGVLIETSVGANVTAIAKGRIVFADWLSGYGFVLILDHGREYMSLYAHNQQLLGKVGDQVRENQQIALAGSSGRSGKPALYFEIRHKGKPVNPAKWILAKKSRN